MRFVGDTGYVVTFRQVDPLYVLDLADPTAPRVTGELKIPGYSAYLHPVGPGLLLGVGRDATPDGATGGVQVSLFDVSDPADPVRLDRERSAPPRAPRSSTTTTPSPGSPTRASRSLPIDSYLGARAAHSPSACGSTPGSADPLGRVARLAGGTSYRSEIRRTVELGGRVYAVAANGVDAYERARP